MNQESQAALVLQEAEETYIGRLFTLGGSVLFFIGSFIAATVAYKTYTRLLQTSTS
ncbi:hypothetical protein [Bacillus sp. S14(2024)]|uniref:hypothetical protein n=1 Tax=Bacillus sp. S14(2024) TaxID=3162884 RepID=UPI003D1BE216